MFSFLKRPKHTARPPAETCIIAIGDIHGDLIKLTALLKELEAVNVTSAHKELVFLGDYVDRGPQTAQLIDFLLADDFMHDWQKTYLMGNHEQIMLEAIHEGDCDSWLKWGGVETLASYGIKVSEEQTHPNNAKLMQQLREALSAQHIAFLEGLAYSYSSGDYFFAHAGINPARALDQQSAHDLMWMRKPFLTDKRPFEKFVIHGHTPVKTPEHKRNRIGIDTGCSRGGALSAVVLENQDVTFISV